MKAYHYIIGAIIFILVTLAAAKDVKKQRQELRFPFQTQPVEVDQTLPEQAPKLDPKELMRRKHLRIIACTLLAEARGEGTDGMYAVAAVISQRALNRKMHPVDVCLQRKQFSCWNSKSLDAYNNLLELKPWGVYAVRTARLVLDGYEKNQYYLAREAFGWPDHYHAKGVKPFWTKGQQPVWILKNHIFYRLNKNGVRHYPEGTGTHYKPKQSKFK
jgi:hypothetical protein